MSRWRAALLGVGGMLVICAPLDEARAEVAAADAPNTQPASAGETHAEAVDVDKRTAPPASEGEARRRWYAVPNIAYDSDDGLGFGARGELAFVEPSYLPYKVAYVVHAFATLRGYHHHRVRYDRVGLGPGQRLRLTVHLAWRQWLNDGYWGIGNGTARERLYVDDDGELDPDGKRYRYSLFQPFAHATLRIKARRPWYGFLALNFKWSFLDTYQGSLLTEQRPLGMDGGPSLTAFAGIIYDSRTPELCPRGGVFAELSGRVAGPPAPEGAGTFGGIYLDLRGYKAVLDRLVLAGRLMAEVLMGDIPFYEMVHWGGSTPVAGFGGFETLRGISFGRWRAPGKAILNLEARLRVLEHTLFSRPMEWELGLFADLGRVFGAGDRATTDAEGWPVHPAGGVGIRAIFERTFVGRFDVGLGVDPIAEPDGTRTQALTWGMYVVFDHAF